MPGEWGVIPMIRTLLERIRRGGLSMKLPVSAFLAGFLLVTPLTAQAAGAADVLSWVGRQVGGAFVDILSLMVVPIAFVFLSISNFVLWVSGLVFNWAVIRTVFQFGTYFGTSDEMLTAWGVMRDVANIGLLFGFIFMGVLLILNVEGGGHGHGGGISAKKAIPRLLIFAVLVNFSLFTTQAVIDVSNGLASVFAEQAGQKCDLVGDAEKCANLGIASVISQRAGITTIFAGGPNPLTDPLKTAVVYVGLSIFVMITAMVLLAGAIMFIYRAVVLSFLMVTSPIGFAGMAIPSLKKIADEWWSKLISQAFFAPVYLLLIFISLKLTETLAKVSVEGGGKGSLASALAGTGGEPGTEAGNIQIVLVFMVVIGFMMASLVTANKMGAVGAKFATKTAGALTIGTAGFVGRRTLGRASTRIANNIRRSPLGETEAGRRLAGIADYGSKASYSLRNVGNKALSGAGAGIDIGTANKTAGHGYHGIEEKAVKERVDYAKSLKGPRGESDQEMEYRLAHQEASLINANSNYDAAETSLSTSQAARNSQQMVRDNVAFSVAEQERIIASNPADTDAYRVLAELKLQLAKEEQALTQSDRDLKKANDTLAKATTDRANAMKAAENTDRGYVEEKDRQRGYARNLDSRALIVGEDGKPVRGPAGRPRGAFDLISGDHAFTLAHHAEHEASGDIVKYAGKDATERALDTLKKQMSKADKPADAPAPSTSGPSTGGGGPSH
ncbi:MAG: hypothetical protein QG636_363 [Patescibacteria group bacterium]|nr:hypothetical protein [Patescibacteria group bacterium]